MRVVFLGSGSAGNATAVSDGVTTVLVDCGFSARQIERRLAEHDLEFASVNALLLTHEHSDHVSGVRVTCKRTRAPVYATGGTRSAAALDDLDCHVEVVESGEPFTIGTLTVLPFATSHDAAEPVGYVIESPSGERVGLATDTGMLTDLALEALADCDILGLETNHDCHMLERGPYPAFLKRRILSRSGHLSNDDAAAAVARLASGRLERVFALHVSRTNNTAMLARRALGDALEALGHPAEVEAVGQAEPCACGPRARETACSSASTAPDAPEA